MINRKYKKTFYCEKCLHYAIHDVYEKEFFAIDGSHNLRVVKVCNACSATQINVKELRR